MGRVELVSIRSNTSIRTEPKVGTIITRLARQLPLMGDISSK